MKKVSISIFLFISIIFLNAGCLSGTRTSSYSQINPIVKGKLFKRVVLFVDIADLNIRSETEKKWKKCLIESGADILTSSEIIYLGEEIPIQQIDSIIKANCINAFLILSISDKGENLYYVPESSKKEGTVETDYWGKLKYKEKTKKSGGYYISKPWCKIIAELIDTKNGKEVWFCEVNVRGNAYANFTDLLMGAISEINWKIEESGLIEGIESKQYDF